MVALKPTQLNAAAEVLDERFGLDALWLFGSEAAGSAVAESDVDLAALFGRSPAALELVETQQEIGALLGRDVDLVDLDRASPILAMQVLRHGKLLLDKNPRRRTDFVAHAPGRYEDVVITRREIEQALLQRVRGGRS